jgi:hypothetical protein
MTRMTPILALLLAAVVVAAADNLTLSVYQNSTNNLFQTTYPEKDHITSLAFSFSKNIKPFSFFTEGGYSHLYENTLVSYYAQDAGLDYVQPLGGKTALYLAIKGGGTLYRSDFSDLNHFSLGGIAALKSYISGSSILKLNYTFDFRKYHWTLFDYLSHLVNLSVDKYFATRTTLRAEGNWGYKRFSHPYPAPAIEATTDEVVTTTQYPGGRGYGGGWGGGTTVPEAIGPQAVIQIASVSGLVAQGIGDSIGLQVSGFRQWTLSGQNPFGSVDEFYLVENPTYDVFSWNGHGLTGQLTFNAPWNMELKIGYTRLLKEFPGIEAMDLDGISLGSLRQDHRKQWDARLEKNFSRFTLFVSYSLIDNHSNDVLFQWNGYFLSAGFELNLNWGRNQ